MSWLPIERSVACQAGGYIFHATPSTLRVDNLNDNIWIIEKSGVCVVGKVYPAKEQDKHIFEITEADRELIGKRYIV